MCTNLPVAPIVGYLLYNVQLSVDPVHIVCLHVNGEITWHGYTIGYDGCPLGPIQVGFANARVLAVVYPVEKSGARKENEKYENEK